MISCLCVTHERHEFMPWVEHQFKKQRDPDSELIIVDSSDEPWKTGLTNCRVIHAEGPELSGIPIKRTMAIGAARGNIITWFDDDDWQHPLKLLTGSMMNHGISAVGARHASMYSVFLKRQYTYDARREPFIFNSGVYRKSSVPQTFDAALTHGEDMDWTERWLATRPTFLTLGTPTHAWLCHEKNIVNRSSRHDFPDECNIPFDDWERDFLAKLFS